MRRCDLTTGASRLRFALESLEHTWQEASDQWDDAVSRQFCERHLEPILPKVKLALEAISRMHSLMNEVQRDCEE